MATLILLSAACTHGDPQSSKASQRAARPASTWRYDYVGSSRNAALVDIAAASADDAWAVGRTPVTGNVTGQGVFLLHRDRTRWRRYQLPHTLVRLEGISSARLDAPSSGGDVWLFGGSPDAGDRALVARWDGARWRAVPVPARFPRVVLGVSMFGADDGWVVDGTRTGWKWEGSSWSPVRLPANASDVAGVSGSDVWAVGTALPPKDVLADPGPAAMHWNGRAWHPASIPDVLAQEPTPDPDELQGEDELSYEASLNMLVVRSADDVQAVGSVTGEGGQDVHDNQLLLRWDGSQWTKEAAVTSRCCVTGQADGVALLGSTYYLGASGAAVRIGEPPYVADRSGRITDVDRKQKAPSERSDADPRHPRDLGRRRGGSGGSWRRRLPAPGRQPSLTAAPTLMVRRGSTWPVSSRGTRWLSASQRRPGGAWAGAGP
ncbi:hypothetical protein ACIRQH_37415 [Streptomyces sp. NPDC102279]|uniref:hypothetical protein n=1 Tax=Streptomyces sp. NPDC102279 TaxID=3366153 RepID=UPI0038022461